ncbi:hypothetical protein Lser_V15G22199 [Lactuca serriola]
MVAIDSTIILATNQSILRVVRDVSRCCSVGLPGDFMKDYTNLSRRVALFSHFFEEIRDFKGNLRLLDELASSSSSSSCLFYLIVTLQAAKKATCSNNDINILGQSSLFDNILSGITLDAPFIVNTNEYKFGYYLIDEIYPTYSTSMKPFRNPIEPGDKIFKWRQEGPRKVVERAFGINKSK